MAQFHVLVVGWLRSTVEQDRIEGFSPVPAQPPCVLTARGSQRAGGSCLAHPFSVESDKRGGLVYVRISGDFDRAVVGQVQSAVDEFWDVAVRGVVFDLSGITFLDVPALAVILHADRRAHRDGVDVKVVRPPALVGRVFTLTRAAERLNVVDHAWEVDLFQDEHTIRFIGLASEEVAICARCRISPAGWEDGDMKSRILLISARDGPICRGCATRSEQIELGEAILRELRRGQAQGDTRISALEEALADLRRSGLSGI